MKDVVLVLIYFSVPYHSDVKICDLNMEKFAQCTI